MGNYGPLIKIKERQGKVSQRDSWWYLECEKCTKADSKAAEKVKEIRIRPDRAGHY